MTRFCPHCGYNLVADQPVVDGPWVLRPDFALLDGSATDLTAMETAILHTLASSPGRPVSRDALAERIGSYGSDRTINVLVYRLRKKLGARCPIVTRKPQGYLWACVP